MVRQKYPDSIGKPDSRSNSNGIAIDSRYSALAHDIRIADNLVEYVPAAGIGGGADWMTIENNVCSYNCWTNIYASSGISVAGPENFDAQDNVYKRLIRNNVCCHNQNYEMWLDLGRYSDGNGIILDVNQGADPNQPPPVHPAPNYMGRTLVQSNLCYDNGGSGIHTVSANRVDVINNTVYLNSASVHLEYSEMFTYGSSDVHFINNVMVAPVANLAAGEKPEPVNQCGGTNTNVTFSHNVYFGGNIAPTLGDGDVVADPQFVRPGIDDKTANFHLKSGSPAVGKGVMMPFSPLLDLEGKTRANRPPRGLTKNKCLSLWSDTVSETSCFSKRKLIMFTPQKMRGVLVCGAAFAVSLSIVIPLQAAPVTLYVATTGHYSTSRAQISNPLTPDGSTITNAGQVSQAGDTIEVAPGTYNEDVNIAYENNLLIHPTPGSTVKPLIRPSASNDYAAVKINGSNNITFTGFEVDGSTGGPNCSGILVVPRTTGNVITPCHGTIITNCYVHNAGGGIGSNCDSTYTVGNDYNQFIGNVVSNCLNKSIYDGSGMGLHQDQINPALPNTAGYHSLS